MENDGFALVEWPRVESPDVAKPAQTTEGRLSTLEERSVWHKTVGWWVAGSLALALLTLVTWWIPRESNSLRDSIKADTSAQLEPIKLDMARINALLQLKETKSVSEAIRLGVDFSEPQYAMGAVKAIMQQAKAENIQTDPSVLIKTNEQLKESAKGFPNLLDDAWSARLSLADYRSSLPLGPVVKGNQHLAIRFTGNTISGFKLNSIHQKLDGAYWKDGTFTNTEIEYDGGPMVLENVRFINCTFKMRYGIRSDMLNDTLLAQNPVTGSFS